MLGYIYRHNNTAINSSDYIKNLRLYTSANFGAAKSHRASRFFLRRFRVYNPIAGPQGPPLSVILLHGFLPFVFI